MDEFDEDLIRALQLDGRAQFSALAAQLGVHRTVVAQRVHELLSTEEIRILAAVHPRAVGLPVQVNLQFRISGPTSPVFERLLEFTNVVFLSEISGQSQGVVEVWAASLDEMGRSVRAIQAIPGVGEVQFTIYDRVLRRLRLGEDPDPTELAFDSFDIELMGELQTDGRLTFGELARRTGRSASACRARVLRLLESGVMRIGAVRSRRNATTSVLAGVGIMLSGDADGLDSAEELLLTIPTIEFGARTLGRYGLIATIAARSIADYTEIVRTIREHPSVSRVETWVHAYVWLERYEWSLDRLERLQEG
ncbi:Lrp/AsnC family transcriptional regulator [Leucobacter luti]|uniref:AsnC family transcriptional regulator n=1 Tax=Leucobacter luti TaxID=340320 RepID=A0A4R6S8H8_9MICO|nr:Lrp/AsnC family transcriptional regulator [Leucobacter luti]MCW2288636.1 DNA-binding Lrp family transcriptional regulator [Leucobacter luti]QYM75435.1 Lrp/AsnC family transcriptional regulator [Leucobacter luti]TCK45208.1 AsnC family transcriptional regulator [Leucobacter luti]TDP95733.1 AsnC family transcriptional regulator [Leucobacter luti]